MTAIGTCEIRWTNSSKQYGLFATKDIPQGTKIFREHAVMINDTSLLDHARSELESQTQQILDGMKCLVELVEQDSQYKAAMQLHSRRKRECQNADNGQPGDTTFGLRTRLPMELYKQIVNPGLPASKDVIVTILEKSLQQINTFLNGVAERPDMEYPAWGPHTAFINHGCSPTATVSCYSIPDADTPSMPHIGVVDVRTLMEIRKDDEITIEYNPVFGTVERRRAHLKGFGVEKCQCEACEHEEYLNQQLESAVATKTLQNTRNTLQTLTQIHSQLDDFFTFVLSGSNNYTPAMVYQKCYEALKQLTVISYYGIMVGKTYECALLCAQRFNDNVRVAWFSGQLFIYIQGAYGSNHARTRYITETHIDAIRGKPWSTQNKSSITLWDPRYRFRMKDTQHRLIFMLDSPADRLDSQPLIFDSRGELTAATKEENSKRVNEIIRLRRAKVVPQSELATDQDDAGALQDAAAASEIADFLAAELVANEEKEAASEERKRRKKREKAKRSRQKKKAAAAASMAEEEHEEGTASPKMDTICQEEHSVSQEEDAVRKEQDTPHQEEATDQEKTSQQEEASHQILTVGQKESAHQEEIVCQEAIANHARTINQVGDDAVHEAEYAAYGKAVALLAEEDVDYQDADAVHEAEDIVHQGENQDIAIATRVASPCPTSITVNQDSSTPASTPTALSTPVTSPVKAIVVPSIDAPIIQPALPKLLPHPQPQLPTVAPPTATVLPAVVIETTRPPVAVTQPAPATSPIARKLAAVAKSPPPAPVTTSPVVKPAGPPAVKVTQADLLWLPPIPTEPNRCFRLRSSSDPERAVVARFFANMPLRPPVPIEIEDSMSDTEMEIRFGVDIRV